MLRWLRVWQWWRSWNGHSQRVRSSESIDSVRLAMLPLNGFFPILISGPDGPAELVLSWHGLRAGRDAAVVTVDLDRETALALKRVIELHFEKPRPAAGPQTRRAVLRTDNRLMPTGSSDS